MTRAPIGWISASTTTVIRSEKSDSRKSAPLRNAADAAALLARFGPRLISMVRPPAAIRTRPSSLSMRHAVRAEQAKREDCNAAASLPSGWPDQDLDSIRPTFQKAAARKQTGTTDPPRQVYRAKESGEPNRSVTSDREDVWGYCSGVKPFVLSPQRRAD